MARLVSLATLVAEGHGSAPSDLFLTALDNGWAVGVDASGQVGLRQPVADRLRRQRVEEEAQLARDAERARIAAQDAEVARMVAAAREQELRDRQRRLESAVGPLWALEDALRKADGLQSGVYTTIEQQAELARRSYSLDELEAFAAREFSFDLAS